MPTSLFPPTPSTLSNRPLLDRNVGTLQIPPPPPEPKAHPPLKTLKYWPPPLKIFLSFHVFRIHMQSSIPKAMSLSFNGLTPPLGHQDRQDLWLSYTFFRPLGLSFQLPSYPLELCGSSFSLIFTFKSLLRVLFVTKKVDNGSPF